MNYPDNIEDLLGFSQVRQMLAGNCLSAPGHEHVEQMRFSSRFEEVVSAVEQTDELRELLVSDDAFPAENYIDVVPYLSRLDIEGYFLLENQLHQVRHAAQVFARIARYFGKRPGRYPRLNEVLGKFNPPLTVVQLIDNVLDPEGLMKKNASRALQEINHRLGEKEKEVHRRLGQLFRQAKNEGWAAETDITIRNGRMVLPILSEHKRKIKGVVHDESHSGQILYIEPVEIIELSNSIIELGLEKRREIERILREVTAELRPHADDIRLYREKLALFDFIRAKAQFAIQTGSSAPELVPDQVISYRQAYHPLLFLSLQKQGKSLVPLDISLDSTRRIIVISGPNAGGKSICLKTVGLLQYMLQCGLLIPAAPGSKVGLFSQVFIDIGDGQSIENSLSTYSAHLTHMNHFTRFANRKTLVLIDELGTGTDPQFGGPLAEAILKDIHEKKAMGVVTTHYTNIKLFAERAESMVNAAMAYDVEHLQPLYRLEIGKPGSSFAFEVAQKIGLDPKVIQYARNKSGTKQQNLDNLLVRLENEKNEVENIKGGIVSKQQYLEKLIADYEELKVAIDQNRKNILRKAREEALAIVGDATVKADKALKNIQKKNAELEKARKERESLQAERQKRSEELKKMIEADRKPLQGQQSEIREGDWVKIIGQDHTGQVVSLMKNKAYVQFGEIKTVVSLSELEPVKKPAREKALGRRPDLTSHQATFSTEIDLRGKRGDEAIKETMDLIDKALLLGHNRLRIVHGRGDGILRKLIRDNLKKLSYVKSLADEHPDMGGDGVTIVELK